MASAALSVVRNKGGQIQKGSGGIGGGREGGPRARLNRMFDARMVHGKGAWTVDQIDKFLMQCKRAMLHTPVDASGKPDPEGEVDWDLRSAAMDRFWPKVTLIDVPDGEAMRDAALGSASDWDGLAEVFGPKLAEAPDPVTAAIDVTPAGVSE